MVETTTNDILSNVKPILRWAGGKRWIVEYLKASLLNEIEFNSYHEPFFGGGAVFFSLKNLNKSYLSDLNEDLIFAYDILRMDCENLIKELKKFKNTEEDYYKIRSAKYRSEIRKAAQFIYLNNYSYNGIYRVNLNGIYNVPYGFRKVPIDYNNLKEASKKLSDAELKAVDFSNITTNVQSNDLVFLDPPYTVAHNKNGFVKYNQKIFSLDDQYRLAEIIKEIDNKGAYFILTNAAHKTIDSIFSSFGRKIVVSRNSLVGGQNAKRGLVEEYIFTNIVTNK